MRWIDSDHPGLDRVCSGAVDGQSRALCVNAKSHELM